MVHACETTEQLEVGVAYLNDAIAGSDLDVFHARQHLKPEALIAGPSGLQVMYLHDIVVQGPHGRRGTRHV